MFYDRNLLIKGSVIVDKETNQFYHIYFDPMIYYENVVVKVFNPIYIIINSMKLFLI
jgi:hypothetical protein